MQTGQAIHFLEQIQSDFDRLRWQCQPIEVLLVHSATNVEAEGVIGIPLGHQQPTALQGAGHREFFQRIDEHGNPLFRDDPIVDVKGLPITNSAGEALDVVMPAFRTVTFLGNVADYQKLSNVAERAGRLIARMKNLPWLSVLRGWRFRTPSELWWAVLFEIAWADRHPFLTAERRLSKLGTVTSFACVNGGWPTSFRGGGHDHPHGNVGPYPIIKPPRSKNVGHPRMALVPALPVFIVQDPHRLFWRQGTPDLTYVSLRLLLRHAFDRIVEYEHMCGCGPLAETVRGLPVLIHRFWRASSFCYNRKSFVDSPTCELREPFHPRLVHNPLAIADYLFDVAS